ncbi:MAG TPA: pyridoxal-phosphate dependent enzyme [Kineosporiaceae bacterium]
MPLLTVDDVRAAAVRLAGVAHRTPVVTSRTLDGLTGGSVLLKAENLQRMGAFKFRGAYHAVSRLDGAALAAGVVAPSSGNHAQALALAARLSGTTAVIVMPQDTPRAKREATAGYGARIVEYDRYRQDREAIARALAAERGLTLVHPYDDLAVMAGAGTTALELVEDAGPLDVLLVCLGGGGLLSGCATAAKGLLPQVRVIGVEPAAGDDWQRSLAAGHPVTVPVPRSIADGQLATRPGELTWQVAGPLLDAVVTVTDDQISRAMAWAFERLKLVLEPSGATALAAVLCGAVDVRGARVGVTLSGGNVDPARFAELTGHAG